MVKSVALLCHCLSALVGRLYTITTLACRAIPLVRVTKRAITYLPCCLFMTMTQAYADDWHAQANYPGRVLAMSWGGSVLSAGQSVSFGSWSVSFGPGGPPIFYRYYNQFNEWFSPPTSDENRVVLAQLPFSCTNTITGQKGCWISLVPAQNGRPDNCSIQFNPNGIIPISCPTDITFQH